MVESKRNIYFFNGYLGSGKTTLINQLLLSEKLSKVFIIENEMASYSVDNQCLHLDPKQIKVIAGECICCADPEKLVKILKEINSKDFENVIIESSGVTSMNQLLEKILQDKELSEMFQIKACVLVVDALGLERTNIFDLEVSDFVVVTKMDVVTEERKIKKVEKFIKEDFKHADFHIKNNESDTKWIEELEKNNSKSFRDWGLKINDAKHHGQNFVEIVDLGGQKINTHNIFKNMYLYQIIRIKGFYQKDGKKIHVEMTPEQSKEEDKQAEKNALVVIGENKLLLKEFVSQIILEK